jgi:antitoxin CptB
MGSNWEGDGYIAAKPPGGDGNLSDRSIVMSGTTRSSAGLDVRRRQILYRSWHRGMREMDLIMGRFADAEIGELSEEDLAEFERLIEVTDRDLLGWITGEIETPQNYNTSLFRRLKAFHTHTSPIHS